MARGVVAFRALALAWAWIGLLLEREHLNRPVEAIAVLTVASVFTLWISLAVARGQNVFRPPLVVGELALGVSLLVIDGLVYSALRQQSLPWAWPAAGIITAAVVGGTRWGLAASALIAGASVAGESILRDTTSWTVGAASKSALFVLAAVAAGSVAWRLRDAEKAISLARSREETARVLHDGVLQTLAVISRRSPDEDLRSLAAAQERELRAYVSDRPNGTAPLPAALLHTVDTILRRHGLNVELVVAEDLPTIGEEAVAALTGAVGEALTNAAKHSTAERVVVFVEPDEGEHEVFCSVRDNGTGFDNKDTPDGLGLRHSIRERIEEVGGKVDIHTKVGRGTEVRLWVS